MILKLIVAASAITLQLASLSAQTASVSLASSLPSGQPVGTPVLWTATVSNGGSPIPLFQFSVQDTTGTWNTIRDYSPLNTFAWTPLVEGPYTIAVRVYDKLLATTYKNGGIFQFTSRVTGNLPVVSPTTHPLVALYSAPPCTGSVRVYFQSPGKTNLLSTPAQTCTLGKSVNFYIAGLYANTKYSLQQLTTANGSSVPGPVLSFTTASPTIALPIVAPYLPPGPSTSSEHVLLFCSFANTYPQVPAVASDLNGQPLWYLPIDPLLPAPVVQRPVPGGDMMLLVSNVAQNKAVLPGQYLREIDLTGGLVRETSVWAINMELASLGSKTGINWLSHEGLRLANGHTLVFGSVEKILTNIQGPGPVDVVGDMLIDLDPGMKVSWTWSAFDHLNTSRQATLNETCTTHVGCGPLYLATQANDWTHANSIAYIPADGNLVVSLRNQDLVIKINYQNGSGSGNLLWQLGAGADFTLNSSDPSAWFSHQHDVEFDGVNFEVFDNGNTRFFADPGGAQKSRGQVWKLDEVGLVATPLLDADLDTFYPAAGSSRRLLNGNLMYAGTNIYGSAPPRGDAYELNPNDGSQVSLFTFTSYIYRVFRVSDLYSYEP